MQYSEAIKYLYEATPVFEHMGASAYKPGLQTTIALDNHYGNAHRHYPTIHVAGTNGKGSCSHSLASILMETGMKVGLYTSPHLRDFSERIRVNGQPVEHSFVAKFVEDFIEWNGTGSAAKLHPSFFELTTIMAFKYFEIQKVDVAVIEVGLGGRLDCTNIITPRLSIITNISIDHTQFLGNTLAAIAAEKAGIIKPNVPVVIGETTAETRPVFLNKCKEMNAPIHFAEQCSSNLLEQVDFELKGNYQEKNKRTIICAAELLKLPETAIEKGMTKVCENTGLMGRWQVLRHAPLVICDTGHNLGGWQYLAPQIEAQSCRQLRVVFGMVDDKDIDGVMALLPKNGTYYFTKANNHRAIPEHVVMEKALAKGLIGKAYPTVKEAYMTALSESQPDDFIFIGGSSYIVADLLS